MSEMIVKQELEYSINQALDKVLPYEPHTPTALDEVLVDEAILDARVRVECVSDEIERRGITGGMAATIEVGELYKDMYPEESSFIDIEIVNGDVSRSWLLSQYGTEATRRDATTTLAQQYGVRTASTIIERCVRNHFSTSQARQYLNAIREFTQDLHDIRFISTDDLLLPPLLQLGTRIATVYGASVPVFIEDFNRYLKEDVIGHEDLIGEDGTVMWDMTYGLYQWVEGRVSEYLQKGVFRTPSETLSDEDWNEFAGDFSAYGSDAPFFEEVRRRRLILADAAMSMVEVS